MSKRIDYQHFASKFTYGTGQGPVGNWTKAELKILLDEINRMYKREDELLDALRIINDDLNEGMAQGHLPIESTHGVSARKIRNFANRASLGMSVDKPKCRNCGATTNLHQNRFDKKHDCGACLQELQDMNDFDSQHTF